MPVPFSSISRSRLPTLRIGFRRTPPTSRKSGESALLLHRKSRTSWFGPRRPRHLRSRIRNLRKLLPRSRSILVIRFFHVQSNGSLQWTHQSLLRPDESCPTTARCYLLLNVI